MPRARVAMLVIALDLVVPVVLFVRGWPRPVRQFRGEGNFITLFSVSQCVLVAAILGAIFLASRIGRRAGTDRSPRSWPWALFAIGFLFMGADERFEIHEHISTDVLLPRGILTDLDWIYASDVVLLAYVAVGIALSTLLWSELRAVPGALLLYGAALSLIAAAATLDALSLRALRAIDVHRVRIIAEEIGELWAQALFALAFLRVLESKRRKSSA